MKDGLKEFRTRWLRWLAQKCRFDRHSWTELLSSNYIAWVNFVYDEHNIIYKPIGFMASRLQVIEFYKKAIIAANLNQLRKLDAIWCEDQMEKSYKRKK